MLNKEIKICKIITFTEEDFLAFSLEFSSSGVDTILCSKTYQPDTVTPTILVGWNNVKYIFPEQKISKRKITDNVSWVYSTLEDKPNTISDTRIFIRSILSNWLPNQYITYDYVLDGRLSKFLDIHFTKPYQFFLFFSGKAMYLYNSSDQKKILGISLESMRYAGVDVKKTICSIVEKYSPICFSYNNVSPYLTDGRELSFETIENLFWARNFEEISEKYFFDFMMDVESMRYIPFLMSELYNKSEILNYEKVYINRLNRKDIITDWLSKRELFFDKQYENEKIKFKKTADGMQYTRIAYSNKRTITGRINCVDRRFNPQMLPKDSPDRKMIVSRFKNGKIVIFDYESFETKLSLFLSQNEKFIKKYKDKDLHEETGKIIFKKINLSPEERHIGKSINHALLYGGGDDVLKKILSHSTDSDEVLKRVKEFLNPIIDMAEQFRTICEENGYITNSFGTIIKPRKTWAAFNAFIQTMASDILVEKLYSIKEFLLDKKSKFLFQVHDSFIFDIHPDELYIITDIKSILSNFKSVKLQVEHSIGDNLSDCSLAELDVVNLEL